MTLHRVAVPASEIVAGPGRLARWRRTERILGVRLGGGAALGLIRERRSTAQVAYSA